MIQEAYCSFEVAKLLKEKGFECEKSSITAMYNEIGKFLFLSTANDEYYDYDDFDEYDYIAPTHQMAIRWLREVHHIIIMIDYGNVGGLTEPKLQWWWELLNINGEYCDSNITPGNSSYEEAVEAALEYTLKNLI